MRCSVIIPLYNKQAFIEDALRSVFEQLHQNFEVIVIDDGSTDNGYALVADVQDSRVRLVQQANAGVSCARNRGIELAKGELICFLDADDWYHPLYLKTIVAMATRYKDIGFFATGYLWFNQLNAQASQWDAEYSTDDFQLIDNLYYSWKQFGAIFCTDSVTVRREFLAAFQPCFPPGESMGEDQDLWFRLSEKSPFAYCPTPLAAYRYTEGSLCATNQALTLLPVYSRIEQRALNGQIPGKLRTSALQVVADAKVTRARNLLMAGRRYDAFKALISNIPQGLNNRRWWVSVVMCALFSPDGVKKWERWRDPVRRD
ncbi:MAG: glycosyltransferase family 2 protein [Methylobacter sp.]